MEANVRGNASMTWKIIISAKEVINAEARWWLGNGENIKIWKSNWLPTSATFKVQTPKTLLDENALVRKLFQAERKEWNANLAEDIFWNEETLTILSIPINPRDAPNSYGVSQPMALTVKSLYSAALLLKGAQWRRGISDHGALSVLEKHLAYSTSHLQHPDRHYFSSQIL